MPGLLPGYYIITDTLVAPAGTRCLFHQATPPVGWASDPNAFADYAIRTVTGAGGGSGGSVAFSSFNNGGTFSGNAFTISVAQMATHGHSMSSSHTHTFPTGAAILGEGVGSIIIETGQNAVAIGSTASATTGVTLANNGSGSSITPTVTLPNTKFADYGIGVKS